jgi:hypothetical protein
MHKLRIIIAIEKTGRKLRVRKTKQNQKILVAAVNQRKDTFETKDFLTTAK